MDELGIPAFTPEMLPDVKGARRITKPLLFFLSCIAKQSPSSHRFSPQDAGTRADDF
jgi:hypothetical protein